MKEISLERLSAAELLHPDFPEAYQKVQQDLSTPGKIEAVCIHEAGGWPTLLYVLQLTISHSWILPLQDLSFVGRVWHFRVADPFGL
jgi:hypothetical protein